MRMKNVDGKMPSDNVWMIKLFERRLTLTQHFHVTSSFSKIKIINSSVVVVSSDVRPSRNRLRFSVTTARQHV